jgi:hypothetical protein
MSDTVEFVHQLIVFLDVLGQRGKLRRLVGIPQTEDERKVFEDTVRETGIAPVSWTR